MEVLKKIILREVKVGIKDKRMLFFIILSPVLFLFPIIFSVLSQDREPVGINYIGIIEEKGIEKINDTISYRGNNFIYLSEEQFDSIAFDFSGNTLIGIVDLRNIDSLNTLKFHVEKELNPLIIKDIEEFINLKFNYSITSKYIDISKRIYPIIHNNKKEKISSYLSFGLGMLLYIMILLYNNNITKGVSEERKNKLAEILSLFIDPTKLMLGKIIGQGVISFIQLILWCILFAVYINIISWFSSNRLDISLWGDINQFSWNYKIMFIPLFIIIGILFNGCISTIITILSFRKNSLSILNNILSLSYIYLAMYVASHPHTVIATVISYVPIFSSLIIPTLIPYDPPIIQILISGGILIISTIFLIYISGYLYKKQLKQ